MFLDAPVQNDFLPLAITLPIIVVLLILIAVLVASVYIMCYFFRKSNTTPTVIQVQNVNANSVAMNDMYKVGPIYSTIQRRDTTTYQISTDAYANIKDLLLDLPPEANSESKQI